ncbi:MAG: HrpE/YscL family type III secretion apparatus protein [Chlamydiae bacterium]|nr:HrpE/YscL family type III secretion apparatus protein [Chlamydiota bacterium]
MKFFSLIYQGDVHLAEDEKIIPAKTYSELLDAKEILEKAREDSKKYKKETEAECALLKEKAEETGFEQGLVKFNEHIMQMDSDLQRVRHEIHKTILPIALQAAKKIVARQLDLAPETIVDIVLQALEPIRQNHRVVIFVNRKDKEILEKKKEKIRDILSQVELLSIQERSDVEPGSCIIQTETGMINATLENQWRSLERAFEKYQKELAKKR